MVCAVVILARLVWLYPATYLPRWLVPSIARADPSPPWQWPMALSLTGVRGIVSIAAALAIPFVTDDGRRFPHRDLILFLTFAVILVTLVGQGLLLPTVIRWLGLADAGRLERQSVRAEEFAARRLAIEAAIEQLDEITTARGLPLDVVAPIRLHQQSRLNHVWHRSEDGESHQRIIALHDEIEKLLIGVERDQINDLYRRGNLKDEARRRIERDLDLREARLTNLLANE